MTMTTTIPTPSTKNREQQSSVNSFLVRCICITASFLITGCGVLGFGLTCVLLNVVDDKAAPCPYEVTITAFSVAGGLMAMSLVMFVQMCSRRNKLKREALLNNLHVEEDAAQYKKKLSNVGIEEVVMPPIEDVGDEMKTDSGDTLPEVPLANSDEVDNFAMTQKSADVSYWIEQQKSEETTHRENYSLETTDGATKKENQECSDGEMTAL